MKRHEIVSLAKLEEDMRAVARGERPAPPYAGGTTYDSVEVLTRLLTPENRQLLALIRDRKPASVAELAQMTGRAQPNLSRTLAKLESAGLIAMKSVGRRKVPSPTINRIVVEIDPFSENDRLSVG